MTTMSRMLSALGQPHEKCLRIFAVPEPLAGDLRFSLLAEKALLLRKCIIEH